MKVASRETARACRAARKLDRLNVEALELRELLSVAPYLVPSAPGVEVTPILTVGDSVPQTGGGSYRMVGIPDGMGAFDNGDGTFTVLMNHELPSTVGIARDHGGTGAFVSRFVIDKSTFEVVEGDDLIKTVYVWDTVSDQFVVAAGAANNLSRLCSADLPAVTAFYNPATGLGTTERIFMDGEEVSNGRSFAHVVSGAAAGTSWELPWTGKYAWENHVASPFAQNKTVVVGLDDSRREFSSEGAAEPSEVYVWVGNKQTTGLDIEKAGLVDGVLHGIRVGTPGSYDANESTVTSGERFELVALSDQTDSATFGPLQAESIANTITQFRRVEDGSFDPNSPNDFYFVTTDRFGPTGFSKLWRLRFDDITNPTAGGTIEILINGAGPGEMFDNITVDSNGRVVLQEDIGNQAALGKIWIYDIASSGLLEIAQHNPDLFVASSPNYIGTQDEESSGVIDVSHILGEGYYVVNVQAHKNISATEPELVEMGQLLIMNVGATAGVGFDASTNAPALVVLGTRRNDHIEVEQDGSVFEVEIGNRTLGVFSTAVDSILANGYDGNDHIDLSDVFADAKVFGGNGNDHIKTGAGDDFVYGGDGNDHVQAGDGDDHLHGGAGNDELDGGNGFDWLFGEAGNDQLRNGEVVVQ